jgi:WD40 repeat protein
MARPTGKSSGSGIAQASAGAAGSAAAAPPSLPDESIVPQGELVNKMQQLIQTHEETLSLLAKSTGGAEPTGGTLRRNTLLSAGSDLRLSTRHSLMMDGPASRQSSLMESPSMLSRQSFLDGAGNASVMDVAKKVRLQRRRLGLALSLRDLPEPVCGLLDVDECVWAATSNGHIGMWDKSTHALTEVRNTGAPAVHQLVRASKATVWGVSGKDAFVYVWSIKNGKMGKKLSGHTSKVTALLVVGKHVWTTSTDMSIIVWNAKSFKQVKKIPVTTFLVSMHLHEGRVWMGTESAIMRWDPNTYRPVDVLRAHTKMVTCMVSASANVVWSSSADRTICAWDGTSGALLERFEAHESRVLGLAVAGDTVWSCAADKSIKCWDRTTHKQRRAVMGAHDDTVSCLLYVPDATKQTDGAVWSGSNDQTIGLWICHPKYDVLPAGGAAAASVAPASALAKNATLPALPTRDPAISAAVAAVGKPSTMRREDSVKISRPSVPAPVPSSQSTPVGGSRKMARGEHGAGDAGESLAASAVLPATAPVASLSDESLSASDGATTRERTSTKGSSKSAGSQRRQNRPVTTVLDKADAGSKKESRKSAAKEVDADDGVKLVEDATADAVLIGKADYGTRPAIIAHAVSMRGAADDGEFALISPTWDKPKLQFAKWYSKRAKEEANFKLGSYQLVLVQEEPKIYVANLLVCDEKGALNEAAFLQCVTNLALRAADLDAVIHMAKNDKWAPKEREQQFMALFFRIPRVRVWLHHAKEQ